MAKCPYRGCDNDIVRIQRYQTTVEWDRAASGRWEMGAWDKGTHFHLFCDNPGTEDHGDGPQGHDSKVWGRDLPEELQRVVYPGSFRGQRKPRTVGLPLGYSPDGPEAYKQDRIMEVRSQRGQDMQAEPGEKA